MSRAAPAADLAALLRTHDMAPATGMIRDVILMHVHTAAGLKGQTCCSSCRLSQRVYFTSLLARS